MFNCYSTNIFLFTFIVVFTSLERGTASVKSIARVNYNSSVPYKSSRTILSDFPKKSDLMIYVKSLEKILNFSLRNKNYIDLNVDFGLFILNVYLKATLKQKEKALPVHLRKKLNELLKKNEKLLEFFDRMLNKDRDPRNKKNKLIYTLFSNETLWADRIKKLQSIMWKQSQLTDKQLAAKYSEWNTYIKNIDRLSSWVPKPEDSDMCLLSLATNRIRYFNSLQKCKVAESCYEILLRGTDFGYALTHRLLLLLLARFGRGCVMFTPALDRELTRRFCEAAYGEAEYIAQNGFEVADLMLEQILFCAVDDHHYFLRRSWLSIIVRLQTPFGCIARNLDVVAKKNYKPTIKKSRWKMMKSIPEYKMMGNLCDGHITSATAAVLGMAIRFLANKYF